MNSAAAKLAALNAGLLRFVLTHSDFTDTRVDKLPERPKEDYEWLQHALQNFETDVDRMKKLVEVLNSKESEGELKTFLRTPGQLISSLEELEYLVEDLDNSQNLPKIDGVKPVVDLLQHADSGVRAWAAQLISVSTHNLAPAQLAFLQQGVLARLIVLLKTETVETAIGAISSVTSNNPSGEAFFLQMNGSTLTALLTKGIEIILKVKELSFLEPIVSALVDENSQLRETAGRALLWILNHKDNVEHANSLKIADIILVQSEDADDKLKVAEAKGDSETEVAHLQEEIALLQQIREKL